MVWYAVSAALSQIRRTQEPYLTSSLVPLCTFDHLDQHCQAASSFPYGLPKSLWPVLPYVRKACHVLCGPVQACADNQFLVTDISILHLNPSQHTPVVQNRLIKAGCVLFDYTISGLMSVLDI